jgi:hypothetical protein
LQPESAAKAGATINTDNAARANIDFFNFDMIESSLN